MNVKQNQSFAGQPPTPTQTPPANDFENNVFANPQVDSSFSDPQAAWTSEESTAFPDLLRTPRPLAPSTPSTAKRIYDDTPGRSRALNANAAQLLSTPNFALLSPQLEQSMVHATQEQTISMKSAMRTPPPTNTGNGKRKEKQNGSIRSHKRSESGTRQLLPKPTDTGATNTPVEAPAQFTPLAFGTPDMFNQSLDMPATAPVYPQQRLFWDTGNPNDMELDFSADNPFATPKPPAGLEPFVSQHSSNPLAQQGTFLDFDNMLGNSDYNINTDVGNLDDLAASFGHGVDPNLLFSSTNAAAVSFQAPMENDSLQPYAYQMQEARRERAYAGIDKAKRRRKPSVDSPAVVAALETLRDPKGRPGVRRSMTDSYLPRSGRSSSSSSRAGTSHGGRSSPLKSIRAESKRRHRTSVGLVIGSDGRARLEPVEHESRAGSPRDGRDMEVDSAAYSSGSDSTDTDEIDDGDDDSSQNAMVTSFSSNAGGMGGLPKMGRFAGTGHSQRSSFSSLYSSNSEPVKTRKPSSKRASRHILDPVKEGGSFEDDRRQEGDNAQAALMHSMKSSQRGRYSPQKQSSGLEPFVSSPSTIPDLGFGGTGGASSSRRTSFR